MNVRYAYAYGHGVWEMGKLSGKSASGRVITHNKANENIEEVS